MLFFKIEKVFKSHEIAPAEWMTKRWEVGTAVNDYSWIPTNQLVGRNERPRLEEALARRVGAQQASRSRGLPWNMQPSLTCALRTTRQISRLVNHLIICHNSWNLTLSSFPLDLERLSASEAPLEEECHQPLFVRMKRHLAKGKALWE